MRDGHRARFPLHFHRPRRFDVGFEQIVGHEGRRARPSPRECVRGPQLGLPRACTSGESTGALESGSRVRAKAVADGKDAEINYGRRGSDWAGLSEGGCVAATGG